MGTQGTGRKRIPNRERLTAEDDALNQIAREAEARLAAKRAARAEAREIRMKELERQQKEISDDEERMSVGSRGSLRVEERSDRDFLEKGSRTASTLSAATLASLGGTSSRRGSGDTSLSVDTEASIREIKDSLVEVEEKYRKAMVSNAQLDNEKSNLMYQVDTLKDSLMELEEQLSETRREYEQKAKESERERHAHSVLQFQFNEIKETLKQSEELLTKHGIVLGADLTTNGEAGEGVIDGLANADSATRSPQDSQTPHVGGDSMLGKAEEAQLGSRDGEEVDSGGAESPTVQPQKQQQGQTEDRGSEAMQDNRNADNLSSQCYNSRAQISNTEDLEKAQSDWTTGGNEVAQVNAEHNSGIEQNACPQGTAESDTGPGVLCHAEVKVVITGAEEDIPSEGEMLANGADNGSTSEGLGGEESVVENDVKARSVSEANEKEESKEYESMDRVQGTEVSEKGFEIMNVCGDGSVRTEEMSEEEGGTLEIRGNDIKDMTESQETKSLSPEREGACLDELNDRDGAEKVLASAEGTHSHMDGYMKDGEDEEKGSSLPEKYPVTPESPGFEQGSGSITMDSKEKDSQQKGDAQSDSLLTTAQPQPQTGPRSQQKAEDPLSQTAVKPPQPERGGASGKKKKKKKKGKQKHKGGAQDGGSKPDQKPEDEGRETQEKSANDMGELAEQARVSSREHLTMEEGEKSEASALAEKMEDDTMTEKEHKTKACEVELAKTEEAQILTKTEEVQTLEGCPESTASAANTKGFEKEERLLSGHAPLVETSEDTEEERKDPSPEIREAGLVNTGESKKTHDPKIENIGDFEAENTHDPEAESTCDPEVKNTGDLEAKNICDFKPDNLEAENTHDPEPNPKVENAHDLEAEKICDLEAENTHEPEAESTCDPEVENTGDFEAENICDLKPDNLEAENTRDPEPNPEVENAHDLEAENTCDLEADNMSNLNFNVKSDHVTTDITACFVVDSTQQQGLEEMVKETGRNEGYPQEIQSTQEDVHSRVSAKIEKHGGMLTEKRESKDIDNCEESLMQEEPAVPPVDPTENKPFMDNSVRPEREVADSIAISKEEATVEAPPEGSVEEGEDPIEGRQEVSEDGNYFGEEHADIARGPSASRAEKDCQDPERESEDQCQAEGIVDQDPSKKEQEDTVEQNLESPPQKEANHEEEDEDENGESFEFEEDLEASADLPSAGRTHEEEGAGKMPRGVGGKQEGGRKAELQAEANQDRPQENVESHLPKAGEAEYRRDERSMIRGELGTAQGDQAQPEGIVAEGEDAITTVAPAERHATQRTGSQGMEEGVPQSSEQPGRRDSSKSNKKGKGKGKEECRMS